MVKIIQGNDIIVISVNKKSNWVTPKDKDKLYWSHGGESSLLGQLKETKRN